MCTVLPEEALRYVNQLQQDHVNLGGRRVLVLARNGMVVTTIAGEKVHPSPGPMLSRDESLVTTPRPEFVLS
jgi:hypothetical protein